MRARELLFPLVNFFAPDDPHLHTQIPGQSDQILADRVLRYHIALGLSESLGAARPLSLLNLDSRFAPLAGGSPEPPCHAMGVFGEVNYNFALLR